MYYRPLQIFWHRQFIIYRPQGIDPPTFVIFFNDIRQVFFYKKRSFLGKILDPLLLPLPLKKLLVKKMLTRHLIFFHFFHNFRGDQCSEQFIRRRNVADHDLSVKEFHFLASFLNCLLFYISET